MRWIALCLAGWLAVAPVQAQVSEPLQSLIDRTFEALSAQDNGTALSLATEAEALARGLAQPDAEQFGVALNNLGYALMIAGQDADRARALFSEALTHFETAGLGTSANWITTAGNLATLETYQGAPEVAEQRIADVVRVARGTEFGPGVLSGAASLLYQLGEIPGAITHLKELLATDPALVEPSFPDLLAFYYAEQETAEAEGRTRDAVALAEARIALFETYQPPEFQTTVRALHHQIFAAYRNAGALGPAAKALRQWAASGTPSAEERVYIEDMATGLLLFAQHGAYRADRAVNLGEAQLAVAMAEALPNPDDPRRGLALRSLAWALDATGQLDAAGQALRQAADVLARTEDGRLELHHVLHDLGSNASKSGDLALAKDLYAQSTAALSKALESGAETLSGMDTAIMLINQADLEIDLGRPEAALSLLDAAAAAYASEATTRELAWNDRVEGSKIDAVAARALSELAQSHEAMARMDKALSVARAAFPDNHPDLALMLANAADLFGFLGQMEKARDLTREAVAIQERALPDSDPQRLDAEEKLVLAELTNGQLDEARARLRWITEQRKRPANRENLAAARDNFEFLTWLLLHGNADAATIDEAFQALQWTQVTRSAEAVGLVEARLSHEAAGLGSLLRQRQDLMESQRRINSILLAAYAEGVPPGGEILAAANGRLEEIDADLSRIDGDLAAAGTDVAALGQVRPMSVADVQARLGPRDTLVTFALPGLRADMIPGLDASANKVLAITHDSVTVAQVAEDSTGTLRQRVRAFRCSVAISDPGCGSGGAAGLRGALILEIDPDPEPFFDRAPAEALYSDLFGGIETILDTTDHLIIAPPAELLDLPFQALVTGPGGSSLSDMPWMIKDHAISILPSVSALRVLDGAAPEASRMLGIGDPAIGLGDALDCDAFEVAALRAAAPSTQVLAAAPDASGLRLADPAALRALSRLPDAACELKAIAGRFDGDASTLLLGEQAQESALKRLNDEGALATYDVLVFATHGLVAGETAAAAPGLVLTPPDVPSPEDDGLLTAAEVSTLRLNARLVVLSACNTAAGEGAGDEGLSGLTRAFLHAGARAVMVTQWAVYSEAAVEISAGLFEARARDGLNAAAALRTATLAVLDDPDSDAFKQHPAYWAPFTMVGAD